MNKRSEAVRYIANEIKGVRPHYTVRSNQQSGYIVWKPPREFRDEKKCGFGIGFRKDTGCFRMIRSGVEHYSGFGEDIHKYKETSNIELGFHESELPLIRGEDLVQVFEDVAKYPDKWWTEEDVGTTVHDWKMFSQWRGYPHYAWTKAAWEHIMEFETDQPPYEVHTWKGYKRFFEECERRFGKSENGYPVEETKEIWQQIHIEFGCSKCAQPTVAGGREKCES